MMSGHAYNHTLQAHLASILLSQSSITQLCEIYEDGLHGERCMADAVQDPRVVTLDQPFIQKVLGEYESPALDPLSLYFPTGSTFHPARIHRRLIPTSGDHQKETAFISCKWRHSICKSVHLKLCTLQDRHRQGWIPFLHRGRLLYHPMQRHALGCVWSDMTTEQVSGRLTWECRITKNTLAKWVCVSLYCTPTEEPIGSQAEFSEQYCGACHHNDLRPAQQTDLGQVMWSTEAHLLLYGHYHGDLISLYSGITGDSSVNWQNVEDVGQQLQQPVVEKSFAASKNEEKG